MLSLSSLAAPNEVVDAYSQRALMVNKRALITTIKDEGGEKRTEFLAITDCVDNR